MQRPDPPASDSMDDRLDRALEDVEAGRVSAFDPDPAVATSFSLDPYKTQMQTRGYCRVVGFTLAQILEIVDDLGIDPAGCALDSGGWLYVKGTHRC